MATTDDLDIPGFLDRRPKAEAKAKSWRDVLPIHPAANLFPLVSADELKALGKDIKHRGMVAPVTIWTKTGELLDGRNRLDAMECVGLPVIDETGKLSPGFLNEYEGDDPWGFVIAANIHRRHLNAEQRHDLIVKLVKATPEKSDRQIAESTKASPTTVGKVRAEMEAKGDVSRMDTRTDAKGRKQPAKKKRRTADDFVADMKARKAAAKVDSTAEREARPDDAATQRMFDDARRAGKFGRSAAKFATGIAEQFEAFLQTNPKLPLEAWQSLFGIFNVCATQYEALAEAVAEQMGAAE